MDASIDMVLRVIPATEVEFSLSEPINGFVTESSSAFYVAEDGTTFYVQEV